MAQSEKEFREAVADGDFEDKDVTIIIEGDVNLVNADRSVEVKGSVKGDIKTNGSVNCNNVGGSIRCEGSVTCDDVNGNVSAGGSVSCDNIGGSVTSGGSISY